MNYFITIKVLEPKEENERFEEKKFTRTNINEISLYLEEKSMRGIPIKMRTNIFNENGEKQLSITFNTKATSETNVLTILGNRGVDTEILEHFIPNKKIEQENVEVFETEKIQKNSEVEEEKQQVEIDTPGKQEYVPPKINKKLAKKEVQQVINPKKKFPYVSVAVLGLLSISTVFQQIQIHNVKVENQLLQSQIEETEKIPSQNSKIDTFSRFFLSSYFSNKRKDEAIYQENLSKYVAISTSKWKTPEGNLEQVYGLYMRHKDNKETEVSYMVAVSNEKKETKIKKVTFKVTEEKEKVKVISEPKLTDYSIT